MISETASEIVEDIAQEIVESLEICEAAIDSVVSRIITEEVSVAENICREEMEAAMITFGDGKCKCAEKNVSVQKR